MDVISTVNGGEEASWAIYRGGGLVGMESDNTRPPADVPIDFVDWPFSKDGEQSFEDHLQVVKEEKPMYAVAPDVENGRDVSTVLEYADQLDSHAGVVIVVPKDAHPEDVGDDYRIGIPCQDRFGGVPWSIWEYRNCEQVHLLGGSPVRHADFKHYVNVRSVDTASIVKAAYRGGFWNEGGWHKDTLGFYGSLEASIDGMNRFWNGGVSVFGQERARALPAGTELPEQEREELLTRGEIPDRWLHIKYPIELEAIEDQIDPNENPWPPSDTLGDGDRVPFPGRAAFY
ncbi:DUF6610 family protein [Natrarchaeobius halalkaliphilus]|uniref:DUF6610 family protein n=1 Tax=Natrarchaeobius halalkaliphilus TaxID=1679091 RepID=UPI000F52BCDA|nr:DUF6610 family protein [Natrarchaeobius halalkaliphilus]